MWFIYTGKVDSLDQFAAQLLSAAHEYQVQDLKEVCGEHIATTLSIETVAHELLLADLYQAEELKQKCIEFITRHSKEVMHTEGWRMLTEKRMKLVLELYEFMSEKQDGRI